MIAFTLSLLAIAGCQSIESPPLPARALQPSDFFWSAEVLSRSLHYRVVTDTSYVDHWVYSSDGIRVNDSTSVNPAGRALLVRRSFSSIAVDSISPNSIFLLPAGFSFASGPSDSSGLTVLRSVTGGLSVGSSWNAGYLSGPGVNALPIVASIVDHIDSLAVPSSPFSPFKGYGETLVVRYAPADALPMGMSVYWLIYYVRGTGPVLLEGYTESAGNTKLASRAVLLR